jgi:hypothetical protein
MSDQPAENDDPWLDRAIDAVRSETIPSAPPEHIVEQAIALGRSDRRDVIRPAHDPWAQRPSWLATAALVLVMLGGWLTFRWWCFRADPQRRPVAEYRSTSGQPTRVVYSDLSVELVSTSH